MKVFKFGGASVKNAQGVINLKKIIDLYKEESLIVVISAMGKTTNLMEEILHLWYKDKLSMQQSIIKLSDYHFQIADELDILNPVLSQSLNALFQKLNKIVSEEPSDVFDYEYDRIVPFGEYLSTTLVSHYLNENGCPNKLLDAAKLIRTNNCFREGQVDWDITQHNIMETFQKYPDKIKITQGFIGGTIEKSTVTLGREGSDYSAAIIAFSIDALDVTIWKDVSGLLNADPKIYSDAVKLDEIPYEEAIELSYYGATIIHPKTLKPLQNKQIPLYVKSFENPLDEGSVIANVNPKFDIPSFIFKRDQILFSVYPKDFSFIDVKSLSEIFLLLSENHIKINLMQNSALSFSICFDYDSKKLEILLQELKEKYTIKYNNQVELITIRHYTEKAIDRVIGNRKIFVEQKNRTTFQVVVSC